MSEQTEEELLRRQEINHFAAMAVGADEPLSPDRKNTTFMSRTDSANSLPDAERDSVLEDLHLLKTPKQGHGRHGQQGVQQQQARDAFLAAASATSPGDSGTFQFSAPDNSTDNTHTPASKEQLEEKQSNLDAAIAALSGPDLSATTGHQHSLTQQQLALPALGEQRGGDDKSPCRITPEQDVPMFAEEVIMPRPLFFGAILPPRVVRQARQMVRDAIQTFQREHPTTTTHAAPYHHHHHPVPRLHQLPPAVRNVVGTIRTFGFGVDVMRNYDCEEEEEEVVGSPWVSTFQPVWGHDERALRVKEYRKQHHKNRPDLVLRAYTAPARLVEDSKSLDLCLSEGEEAVVRPPLTDNQQFSMWLRADDDSARLSGAESVGSVRSLESLTSPVNLAAATTGGGSTAESSLAERPMTEQELFSQWARGADGSLRSSVAEGSLRSSIVTEASVESSPFDPSTFRRRSPTGSDDGSVKEDELKKQVGLSDHLSKAIASLVEDGDDEQPPVDIVINPLLLSPVPADGSSRPLTNYELTNGCVPIFGADDAPLPDSGDLGVHETKEEQMRSQEMKRSQEIIEKFVPPNVFGTVACPNPATDPDDFHSWNSRIPSSDRLVIMPAASVTSEQPSISASLPPTTKRPSSSMDHSMDDAASAPPPSSSAAARHHHHHHHRKRESRKRRASRTRLGWWNTKDEDEEPVVTSTISVDGGDSLEHVMLSSGGGGIPKLHLSPLVPDPNNPLVTKLQPSPDKLREDNLPMSHLHAATCMEQTLPFLSDRPPSYRYLQIDTQAIGFPPIHGEIEPLFCSLAIYNVETVSPGAPGGDQGLAPIPDLQRCGRVTEALYFDVIGDKSIEERCAGALWPNASAGNGKDEERLEGTRCGVFPLPSNLSIANLYAVLVVRKVLSEDSSLDPYVQLGKNVLDLEKLRSTAEKASKRHGQFLQPFAFGVAPLLQVFGADTPHYPTSRAVQIPLFRFKGAERRIIDHIMVMLYPR